MVLTNEPNFFFADFNMQRDTSDDQTEPFGWAPSPAPNSEVPPDVFFLVKREDEEENDSNKPIGAHMEFLAGVSPVFRRLLFGPFKEETVIPVKNTSFEAFKIMINYIYKPSSTIKFFLSPRLNDEDINRYLESDEEIPDNRIRCPQMFFEVLRLAEKYEIFTMKRELTSYVFDGLPITEDNVLFTTEVSKLNQKSCEDVSIKLLAKCLRFLLKKKSAGDTWTRFWTLVNNTGEQLRESLAGTPFEVLKISHGLIKETLLEKIGDDSYDSCLYLACSGVDVRWETLYILYDF